MSKSNGKQLQLASKTLTAEFVTVYPEMAIDWLDNHNNINRPKRSGLEDKYTRDRVGGHYITSDHAISFDWNGEMINGQHTCGAIRESGIAETHLVVRGLDPKARMVSDTGAPRRPADILKLLGYEGVTFTNVAVVRQMMNGLKRRA